MGWHQLCSSVQSQVPLSTLVGQVEKQCIAEAGEGLTLTVDYIGAHSRAQGGQIRLYVVTAHRPDGWVGQRTYIVYTQAGGCLEDVKSSWLLVSRHSAVWRVTRHTLQVAAAGSASAMAVVIAGQLLQ